jgi:hypothetical protein
VSALSELIAGRINVGQAILKVVPFLWHAINPGTDTPEPPAPVDGTPTQAEGVKEIVRQAIHAYLTQKLGNTIAEQMAEKLADGVLVTLATFIEGALHGAAAAKAE